MIVFDEIMLKEYMRDDIILKSLNENADAEDEKVRTHQWLKSMDNKRLVYSCVYGDLFESGQEKRILDIGGGYTSLSKRLLLNHKYYLLDFIAHGGNDVIEEIEKRYSKDFWINMDWMSYEIDKNPCDIVIANDIFPDVDQRLELFIEKYLPYCKEMRLVLTFYNKPQYYRTKRVDDSEVLTFLSWDGEILGMKMKKYLGEIIDTTAEELVSMAGMSDSIYWNGRQVVYIRLKGSLK